MILYLKITYGIYNYVYNYVFQDMMQCIAYATADQYHLPTLCHDLIAHGFIEIKEFPRGRFIYITFECFDHTQTIMHSILV